MSEQKELPFPYEFRELDPEEEKMVADNLGPFPTSFIKVGPKGYIAYRPYKRDAANVYNMPLRPTDVFVASYQRSGTTMTQELVWLIANDFNYEKAAAIPLTHRYPFLDLFMFFDPNEKEKHISAMLQTEDFNIEKYSQLLDVMFRPATSVLADIPITETRFIKSHLPMSLMSPTLLDTAKMVYVARDPRDVAVSCYYHGRLFKMLKADRSFKDFWNMFHRDLYTLTPFFEHVKEAWEKRHEPNMLFLFYEEITKDLPATINRVADFLGKKLNEEQMTRLCDHLSIENFKNNKSVNYEDVREAGVLAKGESFIRKGKSGGWRAHFDEEMTKQAEKWIEDNLKDTDLRFPFMK